MRDKHKSVPLIGWMSFLLNNYSLFINLMKNLLLKMSIEDLLLREPGEAQKRDKAMLEAKFLLQFLKASGKRRRRRRRITS
jgi:hypothetical protein